VLYLLSFFSASPSKYAVSQGKHDEKSPNIFLRTIGLGPSAVDSSKEAAQGLDDDNRAQKVAAQLRENVLDLLKVRVQRGGVGK